MTGRPAIHLGPLVFDDQTRHYPLRYPTVDVDTWVTTRWVGPKRDDPTYSAKAKLSFTNDYRGIKTGSVATLLIATPSDPTLRLEEVQFARRIVEIRGNFAEDVNKLFQPGTATPILFSLLDFFYFSFSMLGVGEIIAAKQPVRLLALTQILCTLVIPLALGSAGSKKHD